jgi:tetratricopeptide (TPR) repeat protein
MNAVPNPAQLCSAGQQCYKEGDFLQAAEYFAQAASEYAGENKPLLQAEMQNNRSVALLQAGQPHAAWEVTVGTDQVFLEAKDFRRAAMAVGNQAAALEALGKTKDAVQLYEKSAALFEQAGDNELNSIVLQSLSSAQVRAGHRIDALFSMQSALSKKKHLTLKERFLKRLLRVPVQLMQR